MPYLASSAYTAPLWLRGGHAQTIFPVLFRKVAEPAFRRVRLNTPDDDGIDLDILSCGQTPARGAAILSHGLEGNSRRKYMRGMCLALAGQGWDCVARNFRSCGGEMNATPGMYHSGETNDLHLAVEFCLRAGYTRLLLVGFSMGGNQILKYLGENPARVPPEVAGAAVFSVPCDLTGSSRELARPQNSLYMRYFLRTLREKVRVKHEVYPEVYPLDGLEAIRSFQEFDDRYTAPVNGFASAADYWRKSSSLPFLSHIGIPVLLVNAKDDPFLSPSCYPVDLARDSRFLFLETPDHGGHVGFVSPCGEPAYWSEQRAVQFFQEVVGSGV